ncbi:hypothetical protein myaer102_07930 [Microcystis viridis NIES-102]|jgi:hypothetical protein|uniref:Glycosyltransferase RgtA/B/C/D-like domain-containing protein n=1 Tax=Microcystis viridis NIES-102 TaxID=213615 RepID=A0A3G9JCA6_MICVR|nr:hypothetical protein [Microcystis viridis]BBH38303.1 hypothetical protein myaer102_07930 [Microcystis viridis NIES-102]
MNIKIKYSKFWIALYIYRCCYSILGEVVIAKLTTLGDAAKYQTGTLPTSWEFLLSSTIFTKSVGGVAAIFAFGNPILINIIFQTLGFIGIYVFVKSLDVKERKFVIPLILTPSFSLWSSVASKESIFILALGFICAYVSNIYKGKDKFHLGYLFALYIIFIFKEQYIIAILLIIINSKLSLNWSARDKTWIAIIMPLLSLIPLYLFREYLADLSLQLYNHFDTETSQSTRSEFFITDSDIFDKAFQGMLIAFTGPTLSEVLETHKLLFVFSFIESMLILTYLTWRILFNLEKISLERYTIALSGILWLMFAAYPLSVLNPGSAIRYRTNYFLVIVLVFAVILKRGKSNHARY